MTTKCESAPSPLAVETAKEWIAFAGHNSEGMATTEYFVEDLSTRLESAFAKVRAVEMERCAKIAEHMEAYEKCFGIHADPAAIELAIDIAIAIRKGVSHE